MIIWMSPVSNEESRALRRRLRLKENATAAPTAIKIRTTTTRTEKSRCQVPGDLQTRKNVVTEATNNGGCEHRCWGVVVSTGVRAAANSVKPGNRFREQIYLLSRGEGGRKQPVVSGYQFRVKPPTTPNEDGEPLIRFDQKWVNEMKWWKWKWGNNKTNRSKRDWNGRRRRRRRLGCRTEEARRPRSMNPRYRRWLNCRGFSLLRHRRQEQHNDAIVIIIISSSML